MPSLPPLASPSRKSKHEAKRAPYRARPADLPEPPLMSLGTAKECTMNLFEVTKGIETPTVDKPRAANEAEIKAYMQWQRQRHGLPEMEGCELHWHSINSGHTRATRHRFCIGATLGKMTKGPQWIGEGRERQHVPAQYDNGAYSIIMPGWNAHRQTVTMETLDESGEVAATSTLPIEPKKGGIIWDRAAVRKAAGPVAKAAKSRKRKPAPTVVAEPVEIPAPVAAQAQSEPIAAQDSLEPVEALSGLPDADFDNVGFSHISDADQGECMAALIATLDTPTVRIDTPTSHARRTAAHERTIRRAWKERRESRLRRDIAADHERMREIMQAELRTATRWRDEYQAMANNALMAAHQAKAKRRHAVLNAREALSRSRKREAFEHARADRNAAELAKARQVPTYFDGAGMERRDEAALAYSQGRHALEKSEALSRQLSEAQATVERQSHTIEILSDELQVTMTRALKAERALAAVTARRDGWPPAARVASVSFAMAV